MGGIKGNMWAFGWVVVWGNFVVDAWARKGLMGSVFFTEGVRPVNVALRLLGLGEYVF